MTAFSVDWQKEQAICPGGKVSSTWQPAKNARGGTLLRVVFWRAGCELCEHRPLCTDAKAAGRSLYLHPQAEYEALHQARQHQETAAFREAYAPRVGIEGTLWQGIGSCGLRRSRYVGLAKAHLQNLAIAAAINFGRVLDWLMEIPLAKTRQSRFARLKPAAAVA